jgi:tRNA threonylcarbamoyladenosine biosynthesis protein TsaB
MGVNCDGLSGEDIDVQICQFRAKSPDWSELPELPGLPELCDRETEYIIRLKIMSNISLKGAFEAPRLEPIILAIDTASPCASLAISSGDHIVASLNVRSNRPHSQNLFSYISSILRLAEMKIEEISAFAAATGPGSFTGLRVGLATIKGLADSLGKPCLGVDSLDIQALTFSPDGLRLVMIGAGRGEVYCGLREVASGEIISRPASDKVGKPLSVLQTLIQDLNRSLLIVTGTEGLKYKDETLNLIKDLKVADPVNVVFLGESLNTSATLAQIASRLMKKNQPSPTTPHYVRPSDAEIKWKQ